MERREASVNADVAGAGFDANGGTAAIDVALDVVTLDGAVHADGRIAVHRAGAGAGVEREVSAADIQRDGTGAGFDLPVRAGIASDFHVAGAGFSEESAGDSLEVDAAASGGRFHIVR